MSDLLLCRSLNALVMTFVTELGESSRNLSEFPTARKAVSFYGKDIKVRSGVSAGYHSYSVFSFKILKLEFTGSPGRTIENSLAYILYDALFEKHFC